MAKDLYGVLGVAKTASLDEVKQAYRKLSKEWHPDKHKGDKTAETKFKEINEAYEILGNEKKRAQYDQFGSMGGGSGGGPNMGGFDFSGFTNGADFSDIFENFFGGGRARPAPDNGQDREIEVAVNLADILEESVQTVDVRKLMACETCDGRGAAKGVKMVSCKTCGGTGQTTRTTQSLFGTIQQRAICADCRGSGTVPETPCATCKGEGRTTSRTTLNISIPPGIDDGQTLRVRGSGDAGRRGAGAGDLYVHVRVRPDERFQREGADLHSRVSVPVVDALLGADIGVATIRGDVTLHIPEGTQPNQILRIKGKGLPVLGSSKVGDHYVEVVIDVPKKLSREERKIVEEWKNARQ